MQKFTKSPNQFENIQREHFIALCLNQMFIQPLGFTSILFMDV